MVDRPRNFSKSANRALDVLDYLATIGAPARAAEIADALGIARSSADQLLKTMVVGGYLVLSTQDKCYFPSLRLARFGAWITDCYPYSPKLHDIVEDVHEHTGDIVTLTMLNDCYMQIMDLAQGADEDPFLNKGARVPVIGSAIGVAALTSKTKQEIRKLVARARYQRAFLNDGGAIGPIIENVQIYKTIGYFSRATLRPASNRVSDYWSIAVKVPTPLASSVVLGLSGPAFEVRPRERQIANFMQDAIRRHLPG